MVFSIAALLSVLGFAFFSQNLLLELYKSPTVEGGTDPILPILTDIHFITLSIVFGCFGGIIKYFSVDDSGTLPRSYFYRNLMTSGIIGLLSFLALSSQVLVRLIY